MPVVLTTNEIKSILQLFKSYDFKMIVKLAYQTGLRVSEVVNIKPQDINSELNIIIIRNSKGNKDRAIPLPLKLLEELREYWKTHKNRNLLFLLKFAKGYSRKRLILPHNL